MPRDPDVVARELAEFGCKVPQANLDALAFRLMPDEAILAALLGTGARSEPKNLALPAAGEKNYPKLDEVLLLLTDWRILERCYKHSRDGSWEKKAERSISWHWVEEFYGWETVQEIWVGIHLGHEDDWSERFHHWGYPNTAVDHDRLTAFINTGRRRLQAARFAGDLVSAPGAATIADQLERVAALRRQGHLSDQEFEQAKRKVLYG